MSEEIENNQFTETEQIIENKVNQTKEVITQTNQQETTDDLIQSLKEYAENFINKIDIHQQNFNRIQSERIKKFKVLKTEINNHIEENKKMKDEYQSKIKELMLENERLKQELYIERKTNYLSLKDIEDVYNDIKNDKELFFDTDDDFMHRSLPDDLLINVYQEFINNNKNICKEILIIYIITLFYQSIKSILKKDNHISETDIFIHIYKNKYTSDIIDFDNICFVKNKTEKGKINIKDCVHYMRVNLNNKYIKKFLNIIDKYILDYGCDDYTKQQVKFNLIDLFDEIITCYS